MALVVEALGEGPSLPIGEIDALARSSRGETSDSTGPPLLNYVAVVTGATAGIGKELSARLFSMGATVILVGRSKGKLETTIHEIQKFYPVSKGTLDSEIMDFCDLEAVGLGGAKLAARYASINLLVNNAGIHYAGDQFRLTKPLVSPQGYDVCFAANYLGHFLLTALLDKPLRSTSGSRIVQVSSTYHWQSTGSYLRPSSEGVVQAARGDLRITSPFSVFRQRHLAYANTKLAQILHARALQRAYGDPTSGPRVVSICPNWTATDILPAETNVLGMAMHRLAFPVSYGVLSILGAAFLPNKSFVGGADFVSNSTVVDRLFPEWHVASRLCSWTTLRDYASHILAVLLMLLQRRCRGCVIQRTSPESYDVGLQDALYQWSLRAVSAYLPH